MESHKSFYNNCFRFSPRGAARSARHPVKVEIVGSNPIGGAGVVQISESKEARYANRQSGQAQTLVTCGFDSHSCHRSIADRGWCSSRRAVNPLPSTCEVVGERFDSSTPQCLDHGPVVYRQGHHPLKVEKGVRLPSGLLGLDSAQAWQVPRRLS
jgi:hypothetical protein